jgi:hypothetical protein
VTKKCSVARTNAQLTNSDGGAGKDQEWSVVWAQEVRDTHRGSAKVNWRPSTFDRKRAKTCIDWIQFCREVMMQFVQNKSEILGGEG